MSGSCCGATIEVTRLRRRQRRVLLVVLAINAATFLMMTAAAVLSGSSALLSGALDNLGDALTYGLSLAVVGTGAAAKARVALVKGLLIFGAAIAVALQIGWRLLHPAVPLFETMGIAALLNFGANLACLALLTPHKRDDVNMSSVWECSRNDVWEGVAVIAAAVAVGAFGAGWPDLVVAVALLALFLRSSARVLGGAWRELRPRPA
jgi:Co/Zn/Cd efflux system component